MALISFSVFLRTGFLLISVQRNHPAVSVFLSKYPEGLLLPVPRLPVRWWIPDLPFLPAGFVILIHNIAACGILVHNAAGVKEEAIRFALHGILIKLD